MARSSQQVQSFCERITNVDPDLRQMALFDLQEQLNVVDFVLSESEQEKVVQLVMVAFTSKEVNSEVHSQSVRILTALVRKIGPKFRQRLADHLVNTLWDTIPDTKNPESIRTLRENALMGLKALIEGLADDHKDTVIAMVHRLLAGMASSDTKIKGDILDVLGEIIRKFGRAVADKHQTIQESAVSCLNGDLALRKKAVTCVANLCTVSSDELFNQVLKLTLDGLKADRGEKLRRHIQLCNTITRVAADRFGAAVQKVIPSLFSELARLSNAPEEESQSTTADEVRENILQALDSFVSRCPTHVGPLLPEIIDQCGMLLRWDPNYCDVDDVEDDSEMEDVDDDDDSSWKVRKSAARCLLSVVQARPDHLGLLFDKLFGGATPLLPTRFKERVENVRLEVLETFRALLEASKLISSEGQTQGSFQSSSAYAGGSFRMQVEPREEVKKLYPATTVIVNALLVSARHKSPKVKLAVFNILRDLYVLIGAQLAAFIAPCCSLITEALDDPKLALPQLRPEVLSCARVVVSVAVATNAVNPTSAASLEGLFRPVFTVAEKDRYFKTVVAALRVCQEFVGVVRASSSSNSAQDLFKAVFLRLCTVDADQDVKKAAVDTMATVLRFLEPSLKNMATELEQTYKQLLQFLKNETTRLTVCKAIMVINRCKIPPPVEKEFAVELASFLRKTDRQLRESALRTLGAFVPLHSSNIDNATFVSMVNDLCAESTGLLSEKELFLTSLGLQLLRAISQVPSQGSLVMSTIVPKVLSLLKSPLIQGQCIADAASLLKGLVSRSDIPQQTLQSQCVAACKAADVSSVGNLSTLLGAVVSGSTPQARNAIVAELCTFAQQGGKEAIGTACLGEVGRQIDVTGTDCIKVIRKGLASTSEEVKSAACVALGKAASSPSGAATLRSLLDDIQSNEKQRYFLLRALKECIVSATHADGATAAGTSVAAESERLFNLLTSLTTTSDEGTADVVAECLGRLSHVDVRVIGRLKDALKDKNDTAAVIIAAARHAATGATSLGIDEALKEHLPVFFQQLQPEATLRVRRAVVQLLTQVLYAKPHLVAPEKLGVYLGSVLRELEVNTSLISEVDLGPFKHVVDNGLELRKLAYECVGTLVDSMGRGRNLLDTIGDLQPLVGRLAAGLGAPELDLDIIASARSMLIKICSTAAGQAAVLAHIDKIADALKKSAATAPKDGQEKEKVVEGQKHAIVCAIKLEHVPGLAQSPKFAELLVAVRQSALYAAASQLAASE